MEYEEAIEEFQSGLRGAEYVDTDYVDSINPEAVKLAIEALQKQVPLKGDKTITYIRHCPKCKCVLSSSFNYCDECGQRIKWEGVKENGNKY